MIATLNQLRLCLIGESITKVKDQDTSHVTLFAELRLMKSLSILYYVMLLFKMTGGCVTVTLVK